MVGFYISFIMPVSFFTRTAATNIWKSITMVSSAGSKRGRGKGIGRARVKDFNRGQKPGIGRQQLVLAGLNAPVVSGRRMTSIQDVGPNLKFQEDIKRVREETNVRKKIREAPLERGWSGRKAHGRSAGPPDDFNETPFEGFDSTVLMTRYIKSMSGVLGRTRKVQALVVVGNGKGLAGFATSIGKEPRAVVRHARNVAGQHLLRAPIWDGHTVMHDFFSKYCNSTIFVQRKPKGYGLVAHRVIRAICNRFGITDICAKVEGNTQDQINITKAFFLGLINQKNYIDIANEKQLHLVDLREENFFYPQVLASPTNGPVREHASIKASGENLDFTYYIYDGKIRQVKPKRPKHCFHESDWYYKHLDKLDYIKNREKSKLAMAARYGNTRVHDVFPYFMSNAESFKDPVENQDQ